MEYRFELIGITPLLMHADDVEAADGLRAWRDDPRNKSISVPGDDRSPPWTWQTYLYHDGSHLAIPADNVMVALRFGAAKIPHKKGSTFKALSQSSLLMQDEHCRFEVSGKQVALASAHQLHDLTFAEQAQAVKNHGYRLFVKRAKVGQSKHVRVRPRFDEWSVSGTIETTDAAITPDVLTSMFDLAGRYAGLSDWRPSSVKSPGPYGTFESKLTPIKAARKAG
jgi:hypothetical protein